MDNPFESGHIKNYVLLYASVVVIMVLFFIASTLFNDIGDVEKKVFNTEIIKVLEEEKTITDNNEVNSSIFKLMPKSRINY